MVNYFIYAKDYSSSTGGVEHYHSNGLNTLDQFKRHVEKYENAEKIDGEPQTKSEIVFLHWGDRCYVVNEDKTRVTYLARQSGGLGTEPECIIKWLKANYNFNQNDKIKLLYIITDGVIGGKSVVECFRRNKDMYYDTVVFHAFNENLDKIDISVAASFLKRRCVVYRNNKLYENTNISKEFDYDKINVHNFPAKRDELKSYIRLKYIRKIKQDATALREIDNLKKLRERLFQELSLNSEKRTVNLDTKDLKEFLREFRETDWYKNLFGSVVANKVNIEKSTSVLINYIISDSKSYSFDALKFDTNFDKSVEQEEVINVDFTSEQEIVFPDVILDDDRGIPVVILTKLNLMDKIIFHGGEEPTEVSPASFSKFKSTMECPLFLVNDQDVGESIGYFYTLNVYKQLLANDTRNEPRTRRPFHGGLVLIDTDHFDKYNDYILSATYFDSKKVYFNLGLLYFVLWKNCERKEWMDRNVVEQFKKYAMRRISGTVCKIGLSSLPLEPQVNTSLLSALWYCVELSSYVFKDDPQNYKQERLRGYHGIACYMIEILKHFNYDLNLESIKKRRDLISHVMTLKIIPNHREKVYYLLEQIFKNADGFLVNEIEKPFNLYKLNYLKLNHKEMLRDKIVNDIVHLNDYVHLMYFDGNLETSKAGKGTFEICVKTFRPFFAIDQNKSFYTEFVKNTRKVVIKNDDDKDKIEVSYEDIDSLEFDRILSLYKLFIDCVKTLKSYPTLAEYVEYISKRKKYNNDLVTIFPSNVYYDIKNVFERYQEVIKTVEVTEFVRASKTFVNRAERIKAEKRVKFNGDNDINKFISSEESKVSLKKIIRPVIEFNASSCFLRSCNIVLKFN